MNNFNITQDFIMSEMTREQTTQYEMKSDISNWIKSEQAYNCEGISCSKQNGIYRWRIQTIRFSKKLLAASKPVRINIAHGLHMMADKISTLGEPSTVSHA